MANIQLSRLWTGLAWFSLVSLFVLAAGIGNYAAYVAMFSVLAYLLFSFDGAGLSWALRQFWVRMILASFGLLAIAFAFSSQTFRQYIFIVDFTPLLLVVPAAALMRRLQPKDGVLLLSRLALAGALAYALVGIVESLFLGMRRASGIENSPIHFGDFAMMVGFMALGGLFRENGMRRIPYILGPVFGLIGAILSGTRAGIPVGMVLAALFVVMFWRHWTLAPGRKFGLLAAAAVVLVGLAFLAHALGMTRFFGGLGILGDVLSGRDIDDNSFLYRLEMYRGGMLAFWDAPLFGHGWHNQIKAAFAYMSEWAQQGYRSAHWGYLHNEPLGFAVSAGFLGILSYLALTLAPLAGILRKADRAAGELDLGLALVLGFFISGASDVLLMTELPKTMFVFLTAAIVVLCRAGEPDGSVQ